MAVIQHSDSEVPSTILVTAAVAQSPASGIVPELLTTPVFAYRLNKQAGELSGTNENGYDPITQT